MITAWPTGIQRWQPVGNRQAGAKRKERAKIAMGGGGDTDFSVGRQGTGLEVQTIER